MCRYRAARAAKNCKYVSFGWAAQVISICHKVGSGFSKFIIILHVGEGVSRAEAQKPKTFRIPTFYAKNFPNVSESEETAEEDDDWEEDVMADIRKLKSNVNKFVTSAGHW